MSNIGDYTAEEVAAMDAQTFDAAKQGGFRKMPIGNSVPEPAPVPSKNVWGDRAKAKGEDFTCPSGQICRLRKVEPERLLQMGILDRVTRLEGLAAELVDRAEGNPPALDKMPDPQEFQNLLDTINLTVIAAVEEPRLWDPEDSERPDGAILVTDVDLEDRLAITEHALRGVKALDRFRHPR